MKKHPKLFFKGQVCQWASPELEAQLNEAAARTEKLRSVLLREALQTYWMA